jgi:pyruvate,water dikinase
MAGLAASRVYFNETLLAAVLARAGLPANVLESVVRGERPRLREGSAARMTLSAGRLMRFLLGNIRWLDLVHRELPVLRARVQRTTAAVSDAGPEQLADLFPALLELLEESAYLSAVTTLSLGLRAQYARAATRLLAGAQDGSATAVATAGTAPLRALGRVSLALASLGERDRAVVASGDAARIAEVLAGSPEGRRALAEMAQLLERWGHVATVNTDFATPAWRDDPDRLWRLALASRSPAGPGAAIPTAPAIGIRSRLLHRRQVVLGAFLEARDEVNDVLALTYDAWRQAARAAGAALAPEVIPRPESVHFLDLAELTAALRGSPAPDLVQRVADRSHRFDGDRSLVPPHRLWNLRLPERERMTRNAGPQQVQAGTLRGVPAGPGRAEGCARVIRTADESDRLRPGEILVADHADVGWTPLFTIAGAVVTGAGGALSHAAVVARELGIPAVVGLEDATHLIGDGMFLRVDGSEGTVRIVESLGPGGPAPEVRR